MARITNPAPQHKPANIAIRLVRAKEWLTCFTIPDRVIPVANEARWIGGYRWPNADNPSIQVGHPSP